MPRQGSPSPGRRPQLDQRNSSSQSSKGSPTAGHLSKSHKGSSTKLHKAHAVGHGRHPHARVPSYGKGLHKLSKLGPGEAGESGQTRNHNRSASHTPTGSPTTQNFKRNSSQISLPRTGSKVSMKKNASTISLQRNVSSAKLGNQSKSEKAQTKNNLRTKGTDDAPIKETASFSIGDEQDEDWEEASSSQSPLTTRNSSVGRKTPQLEDPPSPDEPHVQSPSNLPRSPPQSPPTKALALIDHPEEHSSQKPSRYSHALDGDEVSHRLLDRSKHNPDAKISNISATITPSTSTGSPVFRAPEPSMPSDGISRFINGTNSGSGSETPGSISHLQSTLAHFNNRDQPSTRPPLSPQTSPKPDARRVKSAADLSHPSLSHNSPGSLSPPKASPSPTKSPIKPPKDSRVSPYESARGADPSAGKSLTQLKLDLQRMSTMQDTPGNSHPLMFQHGSIISVQNLNAGTGEMKARLARQYLQAGMEFGNAGRFCEGVGLMGVVRNRPVGEKRRGNRGTGKDIVRGMRRQGTHSSTASVAGSSGGRGRVRFEVGRSPGDRDGDERSEDGSVEGEGSGVEGVLGRMWVSLGENEGGSED